MIRRGRIAILLCATAALGLALPGCEYARLLRPQSLKQLNPRMVRLVNELPEVDRQNEAIIGRLFPHGGLSHSRRSADGVYRDRIYAARDQYMWYPSIITMDGPGELELEFTNDDYVTHAVFMPHIGSRQVMMLPPLRAGTVRVRLDGPGLYWFGCPISNHAGRGMLGLVLVKGNVDATARLDRPAQERP